ncbi:MAG: lipoate--protein ligase family protein, partial [Desulfuromonadaceae bacterium]|nr:lipoate--protein ligase family protein [Desulfuromonadaceae bacterium]
GLSYMRDHNPEHAEGTASLAEYGVTADRERLADEIAAAFSGYFAAELRSDSFSAAERAEMQRLLPGKYATEQWNLEGVGE